MVHYSACPFILELVIACPEDLDHHLIRSHGPLVLEFKHSLLHKVKQHRHLLHDLQSWNYTDLYILL